MKRSRFCLVFVATLGLLSPFIQADPPEIIKGLRLGHPRLMVLDDQLPAIEALAESDPVAKAALRLLTADAEKMLTRPPARHVLIGPRLLAQSGHALDVISTCAGLYRLNGDVRFADRARQEMLAVAAFPDWNPSHFLDVAVMTNACGIGYDWLYDRLSVQDRETIRTAIVKLALTPGLDGYAKKVFWTHGSNNWAQVCAGGLTVGALAIADEEPDLAGKIIELTRKSIANPMRNFAPDGGWEEGPGYWAFATQYNTFYLAAVKSALGIDFGLTQVPGFADTALFPIEITGPFNKVFNFADAHDVVSPQPQMFWLATQFNRPVYAAWERTNISSRFNIFHLLWFNAQGSWPGDNPPPTDALFKRVNVAAFRSKWADPDAWFVGFKGGNNSASHAHLDLGTFVLDAMGHRWAQQLGPDDYNLPGYFGPLRWTYYRLRTEGQNTLTINEQNQAVHAVAPITAFLSQPDRASAIADLSAAYPNLAKTARRGICLLGRRRVLVQDELTFPDGAAMAKVRWNFHTPAQVEIKGGDAILTQGDAKLKATILSPAGAHFETVSANPPPPQRQNTGITNLVINLEPTNGALRIAVLLSAMDDTVVPNLQPLDQWPKN